MSLAYSARRMLLLSAGAVALSVPALASPRGDEAVRPDALEQAFDNPPAEARPRVWWHWMNGNVTKDGIAKDIAWMKRVGIGGLQNFDVNLRTPQIVDHRLAYMTPEWKDAFRFAAAEAERQGLELAIASSPGWSETGGPWVPPADGMKKLVWAETDIVGGRPFQGKLSAPPSTTGPFQSLPLDAGHAAHAEAEIPTHYADVAVLAVPVRDATDTMAADIRDGTGTLVASASLIDTDLGSGVALTKDGNSPPALTISYPTARTIRGLTLFVPGAAGSYMGPTMAPFLESSTDGKAWQPVTSVAMAKVPTTVAFAPVTARHFRIVFNRAKPTPPNFTPAPPGIDIMAQASSLNATARGGAAQVAQVTELKLWSEERVDQAEAKAAFRIAPDYYALSDGLGEATGIAPRDVIDLTARMQPDGTLVWTPPPGRWRVLRIGASLVGSTNAPAPAEATGLEVDKFDGAAVRRYMEHYLGMYRDAVGPDLFGQHGLRAVLTDSIEVGTANWTPDLINQFRRLRGYDPTPWLPTLTGMLVGTRADTDRFLYDFRRTLADLLTSEHYGTIAKVAHEQGLSVYGEALEDQRPWLGDDMAMRRHADVPMAALWSYPRASGPKPTYIADMKGASSVAHLYGKRFVAAESMTSQMSPWAFGPADLKRVVDLEFASGVNRPIVHTSVHVPVDDRKPGLSLSMFGQYFNRNESWGELARPWVDYIARNALMLQQGQNVADVAYFHGEEAPITGLYGKTRIADAPVRYAYDFVNADALQDALRNDAADLVSAGGARYKALYLGGTSRRMTLATIRRIAALVDGGATVVGLKPVSDPGLVGDEAEFTRIAGRLWPGSDRATVGKGQVIATDRIESALAAIGVAPDFRFSGGQPDSEILFVHRRLGDGDSYFLSNRAAHGEKIEARFRVTGKTPELWHAETGRSEPASYRIENNETVVPLTLEADGAVHVVFRKPATAASRQVEAAPLNAIAPLQGPWQVVFEANRGAPAQVTMPTLAPLDTSTVDGIRYFSGIATYSNSFTTPKGWRRGQPLWLDLGEAREVAEVVVNGKLAGHAWHAPYRVDLSAVARPGRNALVVRVANLWVNRLIGDRQPGARPVTWTATGTYLPTAPLRRSGLIGPVTILGSN